VEAENTCTFKINDERCKQPVVVGTNRCEMHPHDGGVAIAGDPGPTPKSPPSAFDKIKNLLAIERLIELGKEALEWIKERIPPDIFNAADHAQLYLLEELVSESDRKRKHDIASRLAASLTPTQLLVLVSLAVAATTAVNARSSGPSNDAQPLT